MTRQHHFALLCVYFIALTTVLIQADPMASSDGKFIFDVMIEQ